MFENEGTESVETTVESGSTDAGTQNPDTAPNLIDLDQVEKFKYKGEDWDRDRLEKSIMMQQDYTRKTQSFAKQRQEFQKDQKFHENLAIDIRHVLRDPSLLDKFKSTYPEKFHRYLEYYQDLMDNSPKPQTAQKQSADPQLLSRLEQVESRFRDQEVAAASVQIDGIFKKFSEKYPYADENAVTSKAMTLLENIQQEDPNAKISDRQWDLLFKNDNERIQKIAETRHKAEVQKQLKSNRVAKDTASGGGTPGQAPVKRTFKEATEDAIRDLRNAR